MSHRSERKHTPVVIFSSRAGALALDVVAQGTVRTILVAGELDISTSWALRSTAEDVWLCAPGRVVLSLAACTYCDGRGFAAIASLRKRAGARLRIVPPRSRGARRAFRLAGADGACIDPPAMQAFFASALRG